MVKLSFAQLAWTFSPLVLAARAVCQTPTNTPHPVLKMDLPIPVEGVHAIDNLKQRTNRETIPALEDEYLSYTAPQMEVGETVVTRIEDREADGRVRYTTITTTRLPRPDTATGSPVAQSVRTSIAKESVSPVSPSTVHVVPVRSASASRGGQRKPTLKKFIPPPSPLPSGTDAVSELLPPPDIFPMAPAYIPVVFPDFISEAPVPPAFVIAPVHHPSLLKRIMSWATRNK